MKMSRFLVSVIFFVLASASFAEDRWADLLPRIAGQPQRAFDEQWYSYLGVGDGTYKGEHTRIQVTVSSEGTTVLSKQEKSQNSLEMFPSGELHRIRTDYPDKELSKYYRADFLLLEYQPEDKNLAFQRVWHNEVQDARNYKWGPEWLDFSNLPFVVERLLATGYRGTFTFRTYSKDNIPGMMSVTIFQTSAPLDREKRYKYPRWLRENLGQKPVVLAEMKAIGDFLGGYPFPFYYAYSDASKPEWLAAWGGSPQASTFQWRLEQQPKSK